MNKSNYIHGGVSILLQFIGLVITGSIWAGALFAVGFYLGREHAQQEYKYAKKVATLKWYKGFTGWSKDKFYDVFNPLFSVSLIGLLYSFWF